MNMDTSSLEIFKLVSSVLTPITVLIIGLFIARKIERNRLDVLKEKEWQVKWSEVFLKHAIDFNENVTTVITTLHIMQDVKDEITQQKLLSEVLNANTQLAVINWNTGNYTQFAPFHGKKVIECQNLLMNSIVTIITSRKGDLEEFRAYQHDYNIAVRLAHKEILDSGV